MRLVISGQYWDHDLDLFWDVAEPLNFKIQEILAFPDLEMADALDFGDTAEQLLGVALAAAQVYLVTVSSYHRVPKENTLDLGPTHRSGHAIARLVHHGANFWKHADEWKWNALGEREKRIVAAFHDVGISDQDMNLLSP